MGDYDSLRLRNNYSWHLATFRELELFHGLVVDAFEAHICGPTHYSALLLLVDMIKLREAPSYKGHIFFRIFNELPVIHLIAIVLLIVVKPSF